MILGSIVLWTILGLFAVTLVDITIMSMYRYDPEMLSAGLKKEAERLYGFKKYKK